MSNNERQPSFGETPHTIDGSLSSVRIINPQFIAEYLTRPRSHTAFLKADRESLPHPCEDAEISGWYDPENDEFSLTSRIAFSPAEFDADHDWQSTVGETIADTLAEHDIEVIRLPQHSATFYVPLDHTYAAQVGFIEDTHQHIVTLHTERLNEVYFELDANEPYDPAVAEDTPRYTLLHDYIAQWNHVLSGILHAYGKPGEHHEVTLHLAEPATSGPKAITAGTSHTPEQQPPAHEQLPAYKTPMFDDIGGATEVKEQLRMNALALQHPELARQYGVTASYFLLHGPAGTGKTTLVQAFANEIGAELREFSSTDIINKYIGESGGKVAKIFEAIKTLKHPTVVFFDEFDSLATKESGSTKEREDVKNIMKRELTDLAARYPHIIVAAATNRDPYDFDEALVRAGRMKPIYVAAPTEQERVDVWGVLLMRSMSDLTAALRGDSELTPESIASGETTASLYAADINPVELAKISSDYTGADINEVLRSVRMKKFVQAAQTGTASPISHDDIAAEIRLYQKP